MLSCRVHAHLRRGLGLGLATCMQRVHAHACVGLGLVLATCSCPACQERVASPGRPTHAGHPYPMSWGLGRGYRVGVCARGRPGAAGAGGRRHNPDPI